MGRTLQRNRIRVAVVTAIAGVGATILTGCSTDETPAAAASPRLIDVAEFADAVADDSTFVLNVHVPDEGTIAGTDAAIAFDEVSTHTASLPSDHGTTIAVYCLSGNMSATAATDLADLGYTDVVELDGGMRAWVADGHELLPPAS